MERREPDRAELIETRLARIENAAAVVQVRLRIAPIENVAAFERSKERMR